MKHIMIGVIILVFGYIILAVCLNVCNSGSNSDIVFSLLYLSAVIGGSASILLDQIDKRNKK